MTSSITPTSIVTAYKAHDNATQRGGNGGNAPDSDRFGPAVAARLSNATQGAMDQAAKSTAPTTYDRHGRTKD